MQCATAVSSAFAVLTLEGAQREAHGPVGRPLLERSRHTRIHRHAAHVVPAGGRQIDGTREAGGSIR